MWDHRVAKHDGDVNIDPDTDFKFEVVSGYRDPLSRQIAEAVMINQAMKTNILTLSKGAEVQVKSLNRKYEGFAPRERIITQ